MLVGDRYRDADASASYGRRSECAVLDGLLERVCGGRSAAPVLRGSGDRQDGAAGSPTERAPRPSTWPDAGVESEMESAFTGLDDLCAPTLSQLDALVEPSERRSAWDWSNFRGGPGVVAGSTGALTFWRRPPRTGHCRASSTTCSGWIRPRCGLGFVGMRLPAEPVGLVFAARTTASEDPLAGLPDLRLSGLDEQSAQALLAAVATARLDESVRRRIVDEAHGNPLALRELGVLDFAGGFALPDAVSVPRRIQDQYLTRLRGLPRATQRLVLVAAADPLGDPALLQRATQTLGLGIDAVELAVDAGLLDIGAGVRFRHPLLRSAAYLAADVDERRAAHAALAEQPTRNVTRTGGPGIGPMRRALLMRRWPPS